MRVSGQPRSLKQRAFALGIAVCLAFQTQGNVQAAQQVSAPAVPAVFFPADLREIKIPSNIGSLEEVHQGDERLVILVQDAHSIPTAQRSIRNLIDFFQQTYGLDQIAVEGARAQLDPQIFRSFPDREKLKAVFSQYLESGELTGTTFAAVFNSREADYRAIEDWPLFEEGYGHYLSALAGADETGRVMDALEKDLERRKEQSYAPQLLLIDRAVRDFRDHSANLMDVLETLASVKAPEPGSELALMLDENAKTDETRLPLELEVKSISEKVNKYLRSQPSAGAGNTAAEFNEKLQAFQTSRLTPEQFAVYLKDLARELSLPVKFSGDFQKRVKKQMKIEDIDGTRFFESFERYAASVKEELFRNDEERMLEMQTERLYLLARLKSLELTREQWHQLKNYARRGLFSGPNHIFLEESDLERLMPEPELRRLLDVNLLFYENAELRDEVFSENLEKMFASRSGGKGKAVMLVSGGFHTEGVLSRLKDKGVSYLLLMPKIEALPETVHYKDYMQGLVSWRDYLRPEPGGGVNTYNAFVRATRDRLKQDKEHSGPGVLQENPVVIKEWRDQIIRDLSKKGRAAEAAKYTRFMDETIQPGGETGASGSLLQKVDSFVSGLKELEARGQLTEPNILRLLRPSGIAPELPTNALVNKLISMPAALSELRAGEGFFKKNPGKSSPRSELRSGREGEWLSAEESEKLVSYLPKAQQERMAGQDDSDIMYVDIYRMLSLAQRENTGFLRYALNHADFIYEYADYLADQGYRLDPALRYDILTLKRIVDSVMSGANSESEARAALDHLSRERDFQVLNAAVHRLAGKLENAQGETEVRLTDFLSRYIREELEAYGPLAASFAGYLSEAYLEKGDVLVFLGRGTEQMQQILEGLLGDRLSAYRSQIFELLISTELMKSLSREEMLEYLRSIGVPLDKKIIFIDTAFAATIARPMAEIVNENGGDSDFCLYCYIKPTQGLLEKIKRQFSYFFPQARTFGVGYNDVSELFRANEDAYLAAVHFFDDLLGKRVEKVWRLQNGEPEIKPTLTGKFYRISRDAVQAWIENETQRNVRSELRSQEASEVLRVYQSLIAWRVFSILARGLLRPMTARAMIESGEIPVPQELSEALLPFGIDVRQLLFASSADAKLAPEAYKENDKGALVVIEDIQNPENFTDASYYEDYDDYIRIKVRGLTQGSPYRSPVSVPAERDFSNVQLELEARGARVLNERLENSGMVLLSTDKPYEVLEEEAEYRDGPNILGFRQISAEQIEAFFVPEAVYERIIDLLPEALRAKVIAVSGKKDLREMDGDAPEGLTAPAWDEALAAFLKSYPWEGRTGRNFMMHGTRFDTPSEIKERVKNRSELRTDSSALAAESSLDGLARTAGENLIRFYREEDTEGLGLSVARAVTRGAAVNFESFVDALIRAVEDSLGSETESYSKLILEAMREIASKIKETDYPQKKGVFVLSPSVQRAELDLTQVNAYKDALAQAAGFIDSVYYRFKDNAVLREAVREAGIQRFQPVSNFSSIRVPEDVPALPLLTAGGEKQEALSRIPFMQIGLLYPDNFKIEDSSAIENKFAVFLQFVFGYVAQNVLTRQDFEFLNRLHELAENNKTAEEVFKVYDEETGAKELRRASERIKQIKSELIKPLTEILGEGAHGLLGGLELGSPGILVGQIAESIKAYEAVRKSA